MEWKQIAGTERGMHQTLQALIRLDTSNPPGNEAIAAAYIKAQIEAVGVPCEVVESSLGAPTCAQSSKAMGRNARSC